MNNPDLSVRDVLLYFLEIYIRDRVLTSREKNNILRLRMLLNIDPEKYLRIMTEVKERFIRGDIPFFKDTPENDDRQIFRMVLAKAYQNAEITKAENDLIQIVAEILDLPEQVKDSVISEFHISVTETPDQSLSPEMFDRIVLDTEGVVFSDDIISLDDRRYSDDDIIILLDS